MPNPTVDALQRLSQRQKNLKKSKKNKDVIGLKGFRIDSHEWDRFKRALTADGRNIQNGAAWLIKNYSDSILGPEK